MAFVPSVAGMHELTRSVDGPLAQYLDEAVDEMMRIAITEECPVGPPPEFPSARWDGPPLYTTHERSKVYATSDGIAARFGSIAPHAAAVHNGSRPHVIRARFAKTLRFRNKRGVVVFPMAVSHPGHPAPNDWLMRSARRVINR